MRNALLEKMSEEKIGEMSEETLDEISSEISSGSSSFAFTDDFAFERITPQQMRAITPTTLAYIGDAVFELYVRSRLLWPSKRIHDYHVAVVSHVKAEQQAHYVEVLLPHLSEAEQDILRRGRNSTSGKQRRANAQHYQQATGFEALLGFLYLSDRTRLTTLLNHLSI